MAEWTQSLNLSPPVALSPAVTGINDLLSTAGTALDTAQTAADGISALFSMQISPTALAAQTLLQQVKNLIQDVFAIGGYKLIAHPFVPGVGKGSGVMRNLSFPNCVKVLAGKFDDRQDLRRPVVSTDTEMEIIAINAGAPSPSLFASAITSFNALLSLKEFRLIERRVKAALELDKNRFVRKQGARLPHWSSWQLRDIQAAGDLEKTLIDNLGLVEAYAKGAENVFDGVAQAITKKNAQASSLRTRVADAQTALSGGLANSGVYTLYASAQGTSGIKKELEDATLGAGHELSFCAGLVIVAPAPGLGPLKEILQL